MKADMISMLVLRLMNKVIKVYGILLKGRLHIILENENYTIR